jgi:hypothetical protein
MVGTGAMCALGQVIRPVHDSLPSLIVLNIGQFFRHTLFFYDF